MSIKTKCVNCGRTYINYNDLCTICRNVKENPFAVLTSLDAIDIDKEHDVIYEEIAEQDKRDFPRDNRERAAMKKVHLSRSDIRKLQRRTDRETIKKFKKRERSTAKDVTNLG